MRIRTLDLTDTKERQLSELGWPTVSDGVRAGGRAVITLTIGYR
jgi:hypothetical protein